jgi:DUF4097 and DUF4098 domain-containing protein YvlB
MRKTIQTCLTVIILISFVAVAGAKEVKKDFHKSFDVDKNTRLILSHGDGDVTIRPWDKDVLDVEIVYRAEHKSLGWGGKRDFNVEFKQKGDRIEVIGNETGTAFAGFSYSKTYEYAYTIRAPRYLELELDGDDGNVEIEDWTGDIECNLDDGDIFLSGVESEETTIQLEDGDLRIEEQRGRLLIDGADGDVRVTDSQVAPCVISLEDGDIEVEDSEGDFKIEVDDGNVILHEVVSNIISIEGEDGDVEIDLIEADKLDLDVRTDDGDISIWLGRNISAEFMIDVDDGEIDVDLSSAKVTSKKRHYITGTIRDGGGRIKIKTEDGDVELGDSRR